MAYVILSGVLGYFVFDCYRIRETYNSKKIIFITFRNLVGVSVHLLAYTGAGILALFVSLDKVGHCCGWRWLPDVNNELIGPLLRGFGIGLAGPAGLARGKVGPVRKGTATGKNSIEDLPPNTALLRRVRFYSSVLLMR